MIASVPIVPVALELPAVNESLLSGDLGWRQHDGGHTSGPNIPFFITWANERFAAQAGTITLDGEDGAPNARHEIISLQRFDRELVREGHLAGVGDRSAGLLLQVPRPPVPELHVIERGVEHCRRLPAAPATGLFDGRMPVIRSIRVATRRLR